MNDYGLDPFFKTAMFEGEYVRVLNWYADGESSMFKIKTQSGRIELLHKSELSEFCM
jgi:hypothetical protein